LSELKYKENNVEDHKFNISEFDHWIRCYCSTKSCAITGFSVFYKNHLTATPLDSVLEIITERNTGRIVLSDYPQGRINIKTNINSSPSCGRPRCVKTSFLPQWRRYQSFDAISYEVAEPYTLYPDKTQPQKQYFGYLDLIGEAYNTSDCSGTPYSTMFQDVETVPQVVKTIPIRPMIVVYDGTNSPATEADSTAIGTATCNFLRDALGNGFAYTRNYNTTSTFPTMTLTNFECEYDTIEMDGPGPLQIEYEITVTYTIPKKHSPNVFLNSPLPYLDEVWIAILKYMQDIPVRTVGETEDVMSTRVKSEIATTSPYQVYTNLIPTVQPYTLTFQLKPLIASYLGVGSIPVKASDRKAVVTASCAYIKRELPIAWTTDSMTLSNIGCRLRNHNSSALPLQILYNVDVTVSYGPSLDTNTYYLDNDESVTIAFDVQRMFEDKWYSNKTLEMSTFVNDLIGPNNTYYNYSRLSLVRYLNY
jgi:hypothetical protein